MNRYLKYLGLLIFEFIGLTGILTLGALLIDPNYFDAPLAVAEAGLPRDKAPGGLFATGVTFHAESGYAIQVVLAAKDSPLSLRLEMADPKGQPCLSQSLALTRSGSESGATEWKSLLGATGAPGTYTLTITQDGPGRVTLYFFQGPFVLRMVGLPLLAALLLGVLQKILRQQRLFFESHFPS